MILVSLRIQLSTISRLAGSCYKVYPPSGEDFINSCETATTMYYNSCSYGKEDPRIITPGVLQVMGKFVTRNYKNKKTKHVLFFCVSPYSASFTFVIWNMRHVRVHLNVISNTILLRPHIATNICASTLAEYNVCNYRKESSVRLG